VVMARTDKNKSDDFEVNRSEIFNSDYYFDDIIEELSESGLYSEDQVVTKPQSDEVADSEKISNKMDGIKQDISLRIQKIEQKVLNINEMLFNTKNELLQTIQKMQNSLLLMKFETEEGITKLSDLFKEKVSNDCVKDKAFEELYTQLNGYKSNFIYSAIKPFVHDLLLLFDRVESEIEHHGEPGKENCAKLTSFRDELLEILYRNDIVPMDKTAEGEKFNPEKSNAVDKAETEDENLDNTVNKVLKAGFRRGKSVLRPELVMINKFKGR
jgi:molecular chaperone GrpE (heat shock protein)